MRTDFQSDYQDTDKDLGLMAALDEVQGLHHQWLDHNFPGQTGTEWPGERGWEPLLGVVEEVGELAHAHLKATQGIRGTREELRAEAADAVGDVVIYLLSYCNATGLNLGDCAADPEKGAARPPDPAWAELELEERRARNEADPDNRAARLASGAECLGCGRALPPEDYGETCEDCAAPWVCAHGLEHPAGAVGHNCDECCHVPEPPDPGPGHGRRIEWSPEYRTFALRCRHGMLHPNPSPHPGCGDTGCCLPGAR